ncbi:hypothetical protein [Thermoflexus sp.]|uniref:hypothetical protein n=1 Tax=Thermoflexus sp. TaxID=1969742 RepID=UPI0035E44532
MGIPPGSKGMRPVFAEDPTLDLHLHPRVLLRTGLVYRTEGVRPSRETLERVLDHRFRPEEVAVVENGLLLHGEGRGDIEVVHYNPNEIIVDAETNVPTLPTPAGGKPADRPGDGRDRGADRDGFPVEDSATMLRIEDPVLGLGTRKDLISQTGGKALQPSSPLD